MAISPALQEGGTSTVTVTARDQYDNPVSGVQFKYDLSITDNDAATAESYIIDGDTRMGPGNPFGVELDQVTGSAGEAQFDIVLPDNIDVNDGLSLQIKTVEYDGTDTSYPTVGNPITFIKN